MLTVVVVVVLVDVVVLVVALVDHLVAEMQLNQIRLRLWLDSCLVWRAQVRGLS